MIESEKVSGYFDEPWNWENIKNNQKWILQFSSMNDPFIPTEESRFVNENLNSEYFELDQGHFMQEELPEMIEAIKNKNA
jgi:predicted alpha/beta hydrolase family esterase